MKVTTKIITGITTALKLHYLQWCLYYEKPLVSFKYNKKKAVVNNSGKELEIAFIVAPLTPSERFLPIYLDAVSKLSQALQIIKQEIKINIIGIITPIFF